MRRKSKGKERDKNVRWVELIKGIYMEIEGYGGREGCDNFVPGVSHIQY
jgi:hypothetical protein